jgi:hypothetical protein
MSKVGHLSVTDMQLAGRSPVMKAHTASKSGCVTVAQLASALTFWLKSATLSVTQTVYSATVAVQFAAMLVQLAMAGPLCRHAASLLEQFF